MNHPELLSNQMLSKNAPPINTISNQIASRHTFITFEN